MHYSYLCCKDCSVESKQNSMQFLNLIAKCLAILRQISMWLRSFLKGSLCTDCWRLTRTLEHDVPCLLLKKYPYLVPEMKINF